MYTALPMNQQLEKARLIRPFFEYLRQEKIFLEEVNTMRLDYGVLDGMPSKFAIPLYLLDQQFWNMDFKTMQMVNNHGPEMKLLWIEFHKKIELLAKKYHVSIFPNLVKDFIRTGSFGFLFAIYRINCSADICKISVPPWIKKKDFEKIWDVIKSFNKERPLEKIFLNQYTDEIIEKYNSVAEIERKDFTQQGDILLLIKKEFFGQLEKSEEEKITTWDKTKKSRLHKLVRVLISLVEDLNDSKK